MFNTVIYYPFWETTRLFYNEKSIAVVDGEEPAIEPITIAEAQQHLRLDLYGSPLSHPDDQMIMDLYLPAAREYCESLSGRAFALQQYEYAVNQHPTLAYEYTYGGVPLPIGPVRRIDSIDYYDADNVLTVVDPENYYIRTFGGRYTLYPKTGWPSFSSAPNQNGMRVLFTAGYGDLPGSPTSNLRMPAKYKNAILLMLHHLYANRSGTEIPTQVPEQIQLGLKSLLLPDALRNGFA